VRVLTGFKNTSEDMKIFNKLIFSLAFMTKQHYNVRIILDLKGEENAMEITDIRVRKVTGGGKPKAYVTVTFDDCFVVHNIKIIEGKTGVFIAMPSRKTRAGEYKDVAHPIHPEFRAELQRRILEKYDSGDVQEDGADDI
jgi:stage V sporulation protein G